MVITLPPDLATAIQNAAERGGVAPEEFALNLIRRQVEGRIPTQQEHEAWLAKLREAASDCGVALPDSALSSEGIYD